MNQVADDGVENSGYDSDEYKDVRKIRQGTKVRMEANGGVYLVPINVNGLDLKFIFDTGASSICISSAEATVMVRQGQITEDDILGQQQFQDATGRVSVGTIVNLKTVEIGGIVLHNVEAKEVFEKSEVKVWECRNCGHIVVGTKAPQLCPVCMHPQSYFEVHAENY